MGRACNEKGGDKRACKRECRDTIMSKRKGRKKELKQCKRACNEKGGDKRACKRECRDTIMSKTKGRNPLVKWALNGIAKFTSGAYSKYLDKLSEHTGKGAATQVTNADTLKLQGTSPSPLPVKGSIKNDKKENIEHMGGLLAVVGGGAFFLGIATMFVILRQKSRGASTQAGHDVDVAHVVNPLECPGKVVDRERRLSLLMQKV